MNLRIIQEDITHIKADALVNAANNKLWMGSGVAGALKRVGGVIIEQEAVEKGPIGHGEAVATTAGKLHAEHVIHAAAMRSDGFITSESVHKSIKNSLNIAEKLELESIAFPALGTGVAGFPMKEFATIFFEVYQKFPYKYLQEIILVLYHKHDYQTVIDLAKKQKIKYKG
ncbi:MAG: macro domain-containing protein [Asgard group archaeon]|nr:macro domain-containing protein [Asgard group archaeon]